ncbi:MAG TPA: hypothetical protein VEN79_16565 [Terriglobia bacterium]|nr:hypothetical protein [Terriglobia bacterium]
MASNRRDFALVIAMELCLISPSAMAGADPAVIQPPAQVHRFLDRRNVALCTLDALVMVADMATTRRALQVPGVYEANPLMKSQGGAIALKAASFGVELGVAYMLHKSGHHKAERIVPTLFGLPSAVAAAHNSGIHR